MNLVRVEIEISDDEGDAQTVSETVCAETVFDAMSLALSRCVRPMADSLESAPGVYVLMASVIGNLIFVGAPRCGPDHVEMRAKEDELFYTTGQLAAMQMASRPSPNPNPKSAIEKG